MVTNLQPAGVPPAAYALYLSNLAAGMSKGTARAYASQIRTFSNWVASQGLDAIPAAPYTVALYIEQLKAAGRSLSSITQTAAAISKLHRAYNLPDPCADNQVKAALKAAARQIGTAPRRQKAAITDKVLARILSAIGHDGAKDLRDAALLSLGFMGAFRRSELAALTIGDLQFTTADDGRVVIVVTVRRSKTDQTGAGTLKAIFAAPLDIDAVERVRAWISAAGLTGKDAAPLFPAVNKYGRISCRGITGATVAEIVKARAAAAGVALDVAGHSLRRGFVTSAIDRGATERAIMYQTGHKSPVMVRRYIERKNALTDNAAALFQ